MRSALRQTLGPIVWPLSAGAVLIGLFLLIPILIIFPISLTGSFLLTWPPQLFSLRWFEAFFDDPVWTDALARSVRIAVPVAVIATVLGTLSALGLAYVRRGRRLLQTLFVAPMVLPIITYALGLYDVSQRFDMTGSVWPVIVGQAMLAAPLVFIIVSAGLAGRDPQLAHAAASLGAPARVVLWRVELPLARVSIAAAAMMALAYSFDEIIVAYFLSPPGSGTLPVQILASTRETADPTIAAASMVVIGVAASIAALTLLVHVFFRRRSR
ncbi:ABC transporter permease [Conexibacter woesei]|uniref:ABC transporter permease n=1 Tax=Conexibacter woesei TaxID=191495 RepID=UPI0002EA19D0|nr:ABC transporter permease [Conexibacter woesei]